MGEILIKTCFSPQSEPHTVKLVFSVVLKHFWGFHRELLFLVQKVIISERSSEILRKITFLNKFEKEKCQWKVWIWCKQPFLFKAENGTIINKIIFSPQNEPHTAKLCFSVVLKNFWGNSLKTSLFSPKIDSLRKKFINT